MMRRINIPLCITNTYTCAWLPNDPPLRDSDMVAAGEEQSRKLANSVGHCMSRSHDNAYRHVDGRKAVTPEQGKALTMTAAQRERLSSFCPSQQRLVLCSLMPCSLRRRRVTGSVKRGTALEVPPGNTGCQYMSIQLACQLYAPFHTHRSRNMEASELFSHTA